MVKKIFLLACLFSLLFIVPAIAASSKAKLLTDTSSSANTVPFINAGAAEDSTAATALGVQVGGTEMMRVTATGSVGIGTTSPAERLDLGGGNIAMGYEAIVKSCSNALVCDSPPCSAGKSIIGGGCRRINAGQYLDESGPANGGWRCIWEVAPISSQSTVYCANIK